MFKNAKVLLLPTEKESNIGIGKLSKKLCNNHIGFDDALDNQHLYIYKDKIEDLDNIDITMPLFFISSNEMIKIVTYSNRRIKTPGEYYIILGTTDKTLKLPIPEELDLYPHSYTQKSVSQPSDSFVQKYIEEYNKGNIITEILVEYDSISCDGLVNYSHRDTENHSFEDADEVYICATCNTEYRNPGFNYGKQRTCYKRTHILKVNPKDNTITIKKVKDTFKKDELPDLKDISARMNRAREILKQKDGGDWNMLNTNQLDNWIKENL